MRTRTIVAIAVLCCVASIALAAEPVLASEPGDAQKKAATQAAPAPSAEAAPKKAPDLGTVDEIVTALKKEALVLREDLGKARLDLRTSLNDFSKRQTEEVARLQQKIDELNAKLAAEQEKQSQRNRILWIAIGVVALGLIATN